MIIMVVKVLNIRHILGGKLMKDFELLLARVTGLEKRMELLELKVQACEAEICSPADDNDCFSAKADIEPCENRGQVLRICKGENLDDHPEDDGSGI